MDGPSQPKTSRSEMNPIDQPSWPECNLTDSLFALKKNNNNNPTWFINENKFLTLKI